MRVVGCEVRRQGPCRAVDTRRHDLVGPSCARTLSACVCHAVTFTSAHASLLCRFIVVAVAASVHLFSMDERALAMNELRAKMVQHREMQARCVRCMLALV